ncbi:hypothetical protein [Sphingomonas sp.]|uniref:hypothetical protein n=1 Tax=Sphingomonas sp. TaxID=28214 RepID=UPI002ED9F433
MAEIYALSELDAAVVGMRLKVVFVDADAFKMDGFVSVRHKAAITIEPLDTQMWIMAPASQMAKSANTRVSFQLTSPIVPAIDPIVSVDDTMSTGKKIDTTIGNVIGGLTGTSSYKVEQYTVRLDPAKFSAAMGETMSGTQSLLVGRLATAPAP